MDSEASNVPLTHAALDTSYPQGTTPPNSIFKVIP